MLIPASRTTLHNGIPRSIVSAQLLVRLAEENGMALAACLRNSGITEEMLADPHAEILPRQELQLIHNLVQGIGHVPAIGLAAGARYHLGIYSVWGFAIATSPTPRAGFQLALRYMDLSFALIRYSLAMQGDMASLQLDDSLLPEDLRQFTLERDFMALVNAAREIMPGIQPFHSIEFRCAEPDYSGRFLELCGIAPRFGRPENLVTMRSGYLDMAVPRGDPAVFRACEDHCRRLLERKQARIGLATRVRELLLHSPQQMPDITQLAASMRMSERSLRRGLQQDGTNFRALIDDVRRTLAEEMVSTTQLKLEEVAQRLGYAEASSFIHAFRRWTGESPSEYRERHWR